MPHPGAGAKRGLSPKPGTPGRAAAGGGGVDKLLVVPEASARPHGVDRASRSPLPYLPRGLSDGGGHHQVDTPRPSPRTNRTRRVPLAGAEGGGHHLSERSVDPSVAARPPQQAARGRRRRRPRAGGGRGRSSLSEGDDADGEQDGDSAR